MKPHSILILLILSIVSTSCGLNYVHNSYSNEPYGFILSDERGNVYDALNAGMVQQVVPNGYRMNLDRRTYNNLPEDASPVMVETTAGSNIFGAGIKNEEIKDRLESSLRRAGYDIVDRTKRIPASMEDDHDAYYSNNRVPVNSAITWQGALRVTVSPPSTIFYNGQVAHHRMKIHAEVTSRKAEEIWSNDLILDAVTYRGFRENYRDRMQDDAIASFAYSIRRGYPRRLAYTAANEQTGSYGY